MGIRIKLIPTGAFRPLQSNRQSQLKIIILLSVVALSIVSGAIADQTQLAFPTAEGFGAYSRGGRGGAVYIVTTLADYHPGIAARRPVTRNKTGEVILPARPAIKPEKPIPGSLRFAIDAQEPRTIVFQVAGTIILKAPLIISNPFITIAGQSAPGGGICLQDYGILIHNTHDIVVRYLRIRPGDKSRIEQDAICLVRAQNAIVDHCSTSWSIDENLSVAGAGTTDATVQWCIISESLRNSWHQKGPHGMGSLIRTNGRVSFLHNLYAHNNSRNPRPGTYGEFPVLHLDFRNNVIYNWGILPGYTSADAAIINYIGNYLKVGPSIEKNSRVAFIIGGKTTHIFARGNMLVDGDVVIKDDWALIAHAEKINKLKEPFPVVATHTDTAEIAYRKVLAQSGAILPLRDALDQRIIQDVKNCTGKIINSQTEVGAWPNLAPGTPPLDSDKDGIPDSWEIAHQLDPKNPADQKLDNDNDGYTNLEQYLNNIAGD